LHRGKIVVVQKLPSWAVFFVVVGWGEVEKVWKSGKDVEKVTVTF